MGRNALNDILLVNRSYMWIYMCPGSFYCPGIPSELKSRVRSASSSSVSECPAKIGTSFNNVFRVSPALEGRDKFGSFLLSFLFASTLLKFFLVLSRFCKIFAFFGS